jgi:hypothetical protein
VLVCQEVDIVTSTLASQERSTTEENVEDIPHTDSVKDSREVSAGDLLQSPSEETPLPYLTPITSVDLPPNPPISPIPNYLSLPSADCPINDIVKTPGSERPSVLRCPPSLGYSCSPGTGPPDALTAGATPATSLPSAETSPAGLALTWDNYRDSPTFSLSAGWSHPAGDTLWRDLTAIRKSIASSTDPGLLDGECADLEGIVRIESSAVKVRKVQLVSTECSDLESEEDIMDQKKANKLIQDAQRLQDEMDDLDPGSITRAEAQQLREDVNRIWELKNSFRSGVRQLVAHLESEDANRKKWEVYSKEMVDKVIAHKREVLAAIEREFPTEQMSEYQRRSLELQEKAYQENREVRKKQEESAKKVAWAEAKVRLDTF